MALSIALLKKLSNSAEFAKAASDCVLAQAKYEVIKEKVDAYKKPIFDSMKGSFPLSNIAKKLKATEIPDEDKMYYADLDSPEVKAYWAALDVAHKANGFDMPEGHCPALTAEHKWLEAKWKLCDVASELTNGDLPNSKNIGILPDGLDRLVKLLEGVAMMGPAGKALKKVSKEMKAAPQVA